MARRHRQGPRAGLKRTVRLVAALLQGQPLDARKAAELLGVKEPAARDQLKVLGELAGVEVDPSSGRQVWRYLPPPSTWGLPSVIAACFGTSLAPLFEGSQYRSSLNEVRARLIEGTPRRRYFRNIDRKFWFLCQGGDVGISRQEAPLDDLVEALLREHSVKLNYESFDGTRKTMTVQPLSIVLYQHQLYLLARRPDATLHPFRLARILALEDAEPFDYPPAAEFDPQAVFSSSFGVWIQDTGVEDIEVRLDALWATYAKSHRWHASQIVEPDGEGVRVTIRCRICREVEQWILSFGEAAEVVRPQALRDTIARHARGLALRYGNATGP